MRFERTTFANGTVVYVFLVKLKIFLGEKFGCLL